jgi:hypothetical protein
LTGVGIKFKLYCTLTAEVNGIGVYFANMRSRGRAISGIGGNATIIKKV